MKQFTLPKPQTTTGYPLHRAVAALVQGAPHLWRDNGDSLTIRTDAPLPSPAQEVALPLPGELRLFNLRACVGSKVRGRHVYPQPSDHQARKTWLARQGTRHGFEVVAAHATSEWARIADHKGRNFTLDSTEFTGVLKVTDGNAFASALQNGVGSTGKAFGFSLLAI